MASRTGLQSPLAADAVPNPDPSERTVAQLERDIAAERAITDANNKATREVLETRLEGMDKARILLQEAADKFPALFKYEVNQLRELHEERHRGIEQLVQEQFKNVCMRFAERDKRTEQLAQSDRTAIAALSVSDKAAIAAALLAQKEYALARTDMLIAAIAKMDVTFTKAIEQTQGMLQTGLKNSDEKINDQKSRLDRGEGVTKGSDRTSDRTSNIVSIVIAAAVAGTIILTAIISMVLYVVTRSPV